MPEIVDPSPLIAERLRAEAEEYEPRLRELDAAMASATNADDKRRLIKEKHEVQRAYNAATRQARRLSGSGIAG
jgi:hypothetical protein